MTLMYVFNIKHFLSDMIWDYHTDLAKLNCGCVKIYNGARLEAEDLDCLKLRIRA